MSVSQERTPRAWFSLGVDFESDCRARCATPDPPIGRRRAGGEPRSRALACAPSDSHRSKGTRAQVPSARFAMVAAPASPARLQPLFSVAASHALPDSATDVCRLTKTQYMLGLFDLFGILRLSVHI